MKAPFLALSEEIEREFGPLHVFRPNRDIRFAKDKSPYKTAAAAVTESEGGAAYHVQISGEGLYVGSGYYHLASDQLERYRIAVADAEDWPELAAAVAAPPQELATRSRRAKSLQRAPRWLSNRPSAARAAAHEGHARGRTFGAPAWVHSSAAFDRIVNRVARRRAVIDGSTSMSARAPWPRPNPTDRRLTGPLAVHSVA